MINLLNFRAISLFVVAFLNLSLAIILWYKSKNNNSRKWLGFTALFSCFYAFFCGATYLFWGQDMETSIYWYKTTWLGVLILPCFLVFTYYFTNNLKYIKIKAVIIFSFAFLISYLVFKTDLFVKSLRLDGYNISSIAGSLDPIGRLYIFLCIILSLINLLKNYFKAEKYRKLQIKYFILGTSIFAISGIISASIVPFIIGESPYYDIAAYISFIWIGLTSYAILKYKLMNIKLITAELFVFILWAISLLKIFFSTSNQDLMINIGIFLSIIFFGVILVRSMMKEIKQRELIEDYAMKIERAYELEKKSKEELEALDKSKNQFLLAIQHHLRTPLTAMLGYTDLIITGAYGKQTKKTIDVIKNIQLSIKSLIKMSNDFLDITQFQLGKEVINTKEGVDLCQIIQEITNELKFESDKKKIYLKFENSCNLPTIKADREKLKAAVYNIIDNSVKYTNKGQVSIHIESTDQSIKITVKDTGIGITKQGLKDIFNKTFERGENAKENFINGRGIGLYITKQIITAHKGNIWAESEGENKGSIFYIELPIIK